MVKRQLSQKILFGDWVPGTVLPAEIALVQPADARVAEKLGLQAGAPVVRLHRVRVVDTEPVIHDAYFFSTARAPDFPLESADVPKRLHIFFLEQYGIRMTAVRELLTADLANAEDRKLLGLKNPSAVLAIEDVSFDQTGSPVIYARRRASTANHVYINELK